METSWRLQLYYYYYLYTRPCRTAAIAIAPADAPLARASFQFPRIVVDLCNIHSAN